MNWYNKTTKTAMPIMDEKEYNSRGGYFDIGHNRFNKQYKNIKENNIKEYLYYVLTDNTLDIKETFSHEDTHDDLFLNIDQQEENGQEFLAYGRVEIRENPSKEVKASVVFSKFIRSRSFNPIKREQTLRSIEAVLSQYFKTPVNIYFYY